MSSATNVCVTGSPLPGYAFPLDDGIEVVPVIIFGTSSGSGQSWFHKTRSVPIGIAYVYTRDEDEEDDAKRWDGNAGAYIVMTRRDGSAVIMKVATVKLNTPDRRWRGALDRMDPMHDTTRTMCSASFGVETLMDSDKYTKRILRIAGETEPSGHVGRFVRRYISDPVFGCIDASVYCAAWMYHHINTRDVERDAHLVDSVFSYLCGLALRDNKVGVDEFCSPDSPQYAHILAYVLCILPRAQGYTRDSTPGRISRHVDCDVWMPTRMGCESPLRSGDCEDKALDVMLGFSELIWYSRLGRKGSPLMEALVRVAQHYDIGMCDTAMSSGHGGAFLHMYAVLIPRTGGYPFLVADPTNMVYHSADSSRSYKGRAAVSKSTDSAILESSRLGRAPTSIYPMTFQWMLARYSAAVSYTRIRPFETKHGLQKEVEPRVVEIEATTKLCATPQCPADAMAPPIHSHIKSEQHRSFPSLITISEARYPVEHPLGQPDMLMPQFFSVPCMSVAREERLSTRGNADMIAAYNTLADSKKMHTMRISGFNAENGRGEHDFVAYSNVSTMTPVQMAVHFIDTTPKGMDCTSITLHELGSPGTIIARRTMKLLSGAPRR